jgi:hypothetical protein
MTYHSPNAMSYMCRNTSAKNPWRQNSESTCLCRSPHPQFARRHWIRQRMAKQTRHGRSNVGHAGHLADAMIRRCIENAFQRRDTGTSELRWPPRIARALRRSNQTCSAQIFTSQCHTTRLLSYAYCEHVNCHDWLTVSPSLALPRTRNADRQHKQSHAASSTR